MILCDYMQHALELASIREHHTEEITMMRHMHEEEKKEMRNGYESKASNNNVLFDKQIKTLESKLSEHATANITHGERIHALELRIQELMASVTSLETRNNDLVTEITKLRLENTTLSHNKYGQDKDVGEVCVTCSILNVSTVCSSPRLSNRLLIRRR